MKRIVSWVIFILIMLLMAGCVGTCTTDDGIQVCSGVTPPYSVDDFGNEPDLVNNRDAHDPSWDELSAFLRRDTTNEKHYFSGIYACGGFAEELHNHAEASGIRSSFVGVSFYGESVDHALNAFNTTDFGLVYIDDTGTDLMKPTCSSTTCSTGLTGEDKMCFVNIGNELVCLGIDDVSPTCDRRCYEAAGRDLDEYNAAVERYNEKYEEYHGEVESFNSEIAHRVYIIGTAEWRQITARKADLDWRAEDLGNTLDQLNATQKTLKSVYRPMGVVESINIYW
jgi:hypothetical protein